MTSISGVAFDAAWERWMPLRIEGLSVACIGRADLLAKKRTAGRPKDLADVATLEEEK